MEGGCPGPLTEALRLNYEARWGPGPLSQTPPGTEAGGSPCPRFSLVTCPEGQQTDVPGTWDASPVLLVPVVKALGSLRGSCGKELAGQPSSTLLRGREEPASVHSDGNESRRPGRAWWACVSVTQAAPHGAPLGGRPGPGPLPGSPDPGQDSTGASGTAWGGPLACSASMALSVCPLGGRLALRSSPPAPRKPPLTFQSGLEWGCDSSCHLTGCGSSQGQSATATGACVCQGPQPQDGGTGCEHGHHECV